MSRGRCKQEQTKGTTTMTKAMTSCRNTMILLPVVLSLLGVIPVGFDVQKEGTHHMIPVHRCLRVPEEPAP